MTRIQSYVGRDTKGSPSTILLDSGATAHMTPCRDWFIPGTFKPLNPPRKIRFGDELYCDATGIGSISLPNEMDKSSTSPTKLDGVLYAPAFSLTLISVRKLNKIGLYSSFKGNECKIKRRENRQTILRGQHRHGLYHLNVRPSTFGSSSTSATAAAHIAIDINDLHQRMGHVSATRLQKMVKKGQLADIDSTTGHVKLCEPCTLGKMKKLPFKHKKRRADMPFRIIHSDVGGPVTPSDRHGYKYWITFIDDHSRYPWIYFMKKKSEAVGIYRQWKADMKTHFNEEVGELHLSANFPTFFQSDGGGEYTGKEFESELAHQGSVHLTTAADTPEQNGISERMNQTLANHSTAMLIDAKLPKSFWTDAMLTAAFMTARTPAAGLKGKSPYEVLYGQKVDSSWYRPFGCTAYALIPKDKRGGKFSSKGRKSILLGYTFGKKAYRLLDLGTRKTFHSRHVQFDEKGETARDPVDLTVYDTNETPGQWEDILRKQDTKVNVKPHESDNDSEDDSPPSQQPVGAGSAPPTPGQNPANAPPSPERATQPTGLEQPPPATAGTKRRRAHVPDPQSVGASRPRRNPKPSMPNNDYYRAKKLEEQRREERRNTKRVRREGGSMGEDSRQHRTLLDIQERADEPQIPSDSEDDQNQNHDDDDAYFAGLSQTGPDLHQVPATLKEAFEGPDGHHWRGALNEELQSLVDNDVYEIVPIPKGAKLITSKMVLRIKLDSPGNIERYKIRIVARGFTQREGIDYKEVWAPVANLESIRILVALAAKYDLELDQMDVATAYLNGELKEELYMAPPEGVPIPSGCCWRLRRSLYGLKQAGRTWNHTLDKRLKDLGFFRLNAETCLYVYKDGKGSICFLVVYVDDFLLAASSRSFMNEVKAKLSATFKMRDLGPATYIVGIQIIRNRTKRTISLCQSQYARAIVKRCGMADSKPMSTPMAPNPRLTREDPDENTTILEMDINGCRVSYSSIVGSLMYAAMGTRPDLAYTVGVLGRYSSSPKRCHWTAAKRALRYLNSTADMVLRFDGKDLSMDMDFKFHGFSDSDWSGDPDSSKSTSGYVFMTARGAIGWASKKQSLVALSSTESEYIGLCNAGQHLAWLRTFFDDIGHAQKKPTDLFCDNQAAIILTKDAQFRARTKHIQRKYHFIRDDIVAKGQAIVRYVSTEDMIADIFTKALSKDKHWKFATAMGLRLRTSGSVRIPDA